ncbi:MAG: ABC transporter substrate-binding protein [Thermoanaerobacteraceae bacterium]|nr:ABC transporter substrate-binding protein [Thermoanaerobacteraceae bacterium]
MDRKGLKKIIALIVVASMTFFLITGCSGSKESGEANKGSGEGKTQVLKIAHLAPLTGSAASYGVQIVEAAKMAVEEINAAGGFTGPNGEKITIDYTEVDETSNSAAAIDAAKNAVSMNPHVILGPNRSGGVLAAHKVWQEAKIPAITDATSAQTTKQGNPYTFRMQISSEYWIPILVKTAVEKYNIKKPAVIYGLNDYSKANWVATEPAMAKYGLKPVTVQTFNDGDQDFSAQLVAIKNSGADSIFLYGYTPECGKIIRQRVELGMGNLLVFTERASTDPAAVEIAGKENFEGVVTSTTLSPGDPDPKIQEFIKKFESKYHRTISATHVNHYDSVYIVKSIVEKVGLDREKIREELSKLNNYQGVLGVYSADKEGNLVHHMYTQVYKNGKWELLLEETYPVQ